MRRPDGKNHRFFDFRPRNSASVKASSGSTPSTSGVTKQETSSKDKEVVFVAGSTGRVGSRTVRELIKLGFRVRAGVRSSLRAEPLVQSVRNMKVDSGTPPVEKLEIVECDLENEGGIVQAIGNASIVICCIGASEKEVLDVTGPYRIDYRATKNLIDAATTAKVDHFILLTSLGTNKIGFPAALLNLFWGVLIWKRKAEEALIAGGLPYTIVRPGGMERPTDSYKETHNLVLADEDTYFGGQVSNLQVAELMACMAKNRRLSFCKVVEVIAETTAPLLPMEELLSKIPSKRAVPAESEVNFVPSSSAETVTAKKIVEEKPKQVKVPEDRPLSPYTMYDDLKPPTSPTPTPSTSRGADAMKRGESEQPKSEPNPGNKTMPLSPYTTYDDLKPPSSPSPDSPSTQLSVSSLNTDGSPRSINTDESELTKQQPLSPYAIYDNLKPPTSPSPNAPSTASTIPALNTIDGSPQSITVDGSEKEQHSKLQKQQPLSPYTMYEDLKPPSSPVPAVPKF